MKTLEQIDAIMRTIPEEWRQRWCGGEYGPCACAGCVQIGNRIVMYERSSGRRFIGDAEYINESEIPAAFYQKYKITRQEWELWTGEPIDKFAGDYRFLSNFYADPGGATLEHLYQAAKATTLDDQVFILQAQTPGEAKRRGRHIKIRDDWERVKEGVMLRLLRDKFKDAELRRLLLATGERKLVESNSWGDTYWGICMGRGKNRLGVLLMQVRDEYRKGLVW